MYMHLKSFLNYYAGSGNGKIQINIITLILYQQHLFSILYQHKVMKILRKTNMSAAYAVGIFEKNFYTHQCLLVHLCKRQLYLYH